MAKKKESRFAAYELIHRRLHVTLPLLGGGTVRVAGKVVAAGYVTPTIVYRGNRTPVPFIEFCPDSASDANSTRPRDTVELQLGSQTWKTIEWVSAAEAEVAEEAEEAEE